MGHAHLVQFQSEYLIRKVGALCKALLAAKCKASLLQKRGKQNEKNTFLKKAQQKYRIYKMINSNARDS